MYLNKGLALQGVCSLLYYWALLQVLLQCQRVYGEERHVWLEEEKNKSNKEWNSSLIQFALYHSAVEYLNQDWLKGVNSSSITLVKSCSLMNEKMFLKNNHSITNCCCISETFCHMLLWENNNLELLTLTPVCLGCITPHHSWLLSYNSPLCFIPYIKSLTYLCDCLLACLIQPLEAFGKLHLCKTKHLICRVSVCHMILKQTDLPTCPM